jgi:hypothetical protein
MTGRRQRSELIPWEDAPTVLLMGFPCGRFMPNGFARFWYAGAKDGSVTGWDIEHRLNWAEAREAMEERGVAFGRDSGGYVHVRYIDPAHGRAMRYLSNRYRQAEVRREYHPPGWHLYGGRNWHGSTTRRRRGPHG